MNNLSYTSYRETTMAVSGTSSEDFATDNTFEQNITAAQSDSDAPSSNNDSSLSAYQPIPHGSILPVHRLLF